MMRMNLLDSELTTTAQYPKTAELKVVVVFGSSSALQHTIRQLFRIRLLGTERRCTRLKYGYRQLLAWCPIWFKADGSRLKNSKSPKSRPSVRNTNLSDLLETYAKLFADI